MSSIAKYDVRLRLLESPPRWLQFLRAPWRLRIRMQFYLAKPRLLQQQRRSASAERFYCGGPQCPGYPHKASDRAHPASCLGASTSALAARARGGDS